MQNNLEEQFLARYTLRARKTWKTHSEHPRYLVAIKPIPKDLLQRTRFCVMVDSTILCDMPYDNVVPYVMVVTMPSSRLPEMAEVAVAMFAPELEGSLKEPLPKRFVFANQIDHLTCEGLLQDLPQNLHAMINREAERWHET